MSRPRPIPKDEPCAALAREAIDVQVLRGGARCAYDWSATQSPWSIGLQLKTTRPKSWMPIGAGGEIPASQDQDVCPTPQHTPTDMQQTCATGLARLHTLTLRKSFHFTRVSSKHSAAGLGFAGGTGFRGCRHSVGPWIYSRLTSSAFLTVSRRRTASLTDDTVSQLIMELSPSPHLADLRPKRPNKPSIHLGLLA